MRLSRLRANTMLTPAEALAWIVLMCLEMSRLTGLWQNVCLPESQSHASLLACEIPASAPCHCLSFECHLIPHPLCFEEYLILWARFLLHLPCLRSQFGQSLHGTGHSWQIYPVHMQEEGRPCSASGS